MASKNIQVIYTVNDAALLKAANSLKANEDAAKKADAAVNKYGKDAKKAGDDASKSFLNLGTIWKGLIAIGITTFFVNLAKKTFELGVKQEQLNIAFTTFLGSAEKAKKLLQDLTKFAIVTPFTPDQVNNAAKALLAFGVAGKDIIPTLKMLGDVSSGTGKDLTEMAIIFGQIRSTGRLMGQDLLQLINAGFNPLQIISEQTGKSVTRLKKEMEAGLITFDMVEGAFRSATAEGGRFFNLMEKQSQSVGGLLSTVSGNIDEMLKAIFEANSGPIKDFVNGLVEISEGLLAVAKSEEQWNEERAKFNTDLSVQGFQAFAKAFKDLSVAQRIATEEIDREIESLKVQNAEMQKGVNTSVDQYNANFDRIDALKAEKKAIDDYVVSLKKANEEAALKKQLETDAESAARLAEERRKRLKELLKDIDKPQADDEGFATIDTKDEQFEKIKDGIGKLNDELEKIQKEEDDRRLQEIKDQNDREIEELEKRNKREKQLRQAAFDFGLDLLGQFLMAQLESEDRTFEREKGNFDQRLAVAGDNARARMEIEAERDSFEREQDRKAEQFENDKAKRDKERQVKQMIIQNVLNAIRAIGTPPVPNFALAGITGLFGLAQIAVARAVGFKEGVIDLKGPGTGTSDSIPARLSRGESVITAQATARSMDLLEAINSGKIDDSILRKLKVGASGVTVLKDNSDVVEAIEGSRVDHYQYGHFVYDVVKKGKNLKVHIASKYHGKQ